MRFMLGNFLAAGFAAIVAFAVLPPLVTFAGFASALGLYLVPVGTLLAHSRQSPVLVAMAANFVPLLSPANQMSYDTARFYNTALAILAGTVPRFVARVDRLLTYTVSLTGLTAYRPRNTPVFGRSVASRSISEVVQFLNEAASSCSSTNRKRCGSPKYSCSRR